MANTELGCIRELTAHPAELFKSPFIRPEDLHHYEEVVEVIKLCGRTLGPAFLQRVVQAYAARRYAGNLLDLMDIPWNGWPSGCMWSMKNCLRIF